MDHPPLPLPHAPRTSPPGEAAGVVPATPGRNRARPLLGSLVLLLVAAAAPTLLPVPHFLVPHFTPVLNPLFAPLAAQERPDVEIPTTSGPDTTFAHRSVVATVTLEPQRSLHWELVVPATVEEVWRAWSVSEGIAEWSAPGGYVDMRPGGVWEAYFDPERPKGQRGSEGNEILAVLPGRLLVLRAGAPRWFPTVREERTTFTLTLTPVGRHHTLVQGTQTGWKEGDEWEEAFWYLARANAVWLDWLHQRFTLGPIDWSEGPER